MQKEAGFQVKKHGIRPLFIKYYYLNLEFNVVSQ